MNEKETACDRTCECILDCFDRSFRVVEPLFVLLAASLILLDALLFFTTIFPQIVEHSGYIISSIHAVIALWLLYNVLFSQYMCFMTRPGSTKQADQQALRSAMTLKWRWCNKCNLPKPPMTHHCSICDKCTLKMDHHCPWMGNCVGFYNYKYFYLFLFWIWIGSAYSASMTWIVAGRHIKNVEPHWFHDHFMLFILWVMSIAIFFGVMCLLGWQTYCVFMATGTIDFMNDYYDAKEAKAQGQVWRNPFDLGAIENFKEAFDVHGRYWWLTWALPTRQVKRGNGYLLPVREERQAPRSAELLNYEDVENPTNRARFRGAS